MTEQTVIDIGAQTLWVSILIAAPALLATLITGVVISIFQAATQINEQTLSFIPKIIVMVVAIVVFAPWIMHTLMNFTVNIFNGIPTIAQ